MIPLLALVVAIFALKATGIAFFSLRKAPTDDQLDSVFAALGEAKAATRSSYREWQHSDLNQLAYTAALLASYSGATCDAGMHRLLMAQVTTPTPTKPESPPQSEQQESECRSE